MVFHRMHFALCAVLVVAASGAHLREPADKATAKPADKATVKETKPAATAAKPAVASKEPVKASKAPVNASKTVAHSDEDTLASLGKGLETIHNLRSLFVKTKPEGPADGAEKFANGALSEELSNKDSQVWATIENMLTTTQSAMTSIKGKSKAESEKIMNSLEGDLDKKASVLNNLQDNVSKKQEQQDEEYLLGLLILHRKDWSVDQQLNATATFMHNSPLLQNFYKNHDSKTDLSSQLAALMDKKPKSKEVSKEAPPAAAAVVAKDEPAAKKKRVAKAASGAAKALFIQLASTFRNRDCPYCAAQCVDKCHADGKPYVQCLTDCADAGKN
jgi:hypothetical protein